MDTLRSLLCILGNLYLVAIFLRIIFSWIPISPASPVAVVRSALVRATEPVLGPLRRTLPPLRIGMVAVDLSPIIVVLLLQVVVLGAILDCG